MRVTIQWRGRRVAYNLAQYGASGSGHVLILNFSLRVTPAVELEIERLSFALNAFRNLPDNLRADLNVTRTP